MGISDLSLPHPRLGTHLQGLRRTQQDTRFAPAPSPADLEGMGVIPVMATPGHLLVPMPRLVPREGVVTWLPTGTALTQAPLPPTPSQELSPSCHSWAHPQVSTGPQLGRSHLQTGWDSGVGPWGAQGPASTWTELGSGEPVSS